MHRRTAAIIVSLALTAPLSLLGTPASAAPVVKPARAYDFNGDGFADLAVGAPDLDYKAELAGALVVLPASAKGLGSPGRVFTADSPGIAGTPGTEEGLGGSVASADFDGDGYADLALGRPGAYRRYEGAGAVAILYGSATGLTSARAVELLQPGGPDFDVAFAAELVAADFDGDGRSDLAVSAPNAEDSSAYQGQGTVTLFPGSATGLSASRSSVLRGDRTDARHDQYFGERLAVGDLDQDGRLDLVVGSAGSLPRGGTGYPAAVSACYSSAAGVGPCTQLTRSAALSEARSLAVGNVTGTSRPEVVVGVPAYDDKRGGRVETLSLTGPRAATTVVRTTLTQDSKGVRGSGEKGDEFGGSVAVGDLDGDGHADLVVGAPGEDKDAGRVTVVFGGSNGYRTSGGLIYDQSTKGIPGKREKGDRFGEAVTLIDHNRDKRLDLDVGASGENDGTGTVTTIPGGKTKLSTGDANAFSLRDAGYRDSDGGEFGAVLGR